MTHWSDDPVDTEALAPGGPGLRLGGRHRRQHRRPARRSRSPGCRSAGGTGPCTRATYELTYPDGATDAETLLRDPSSGRLYIASKNVFGGVLYAVPEHLDASGPNRLEPTGRVLPVATDGAFFPDGEHVVVRNYTSAVVYDWPSLQPVGSFRLPSQRQGEGIAVAADGKVYVSSEGPRAPVLEVPLPPKVTLGDRRSLAWSGFADDRRAERGADHRGLGPVRHGARRLLARPLAVVGRRRARRRGPRRTPPGAAAALSPGWSHTFGWARISGRGREHGSMARLRRSSPDDPGWRRRRAGTGFVYLDESGTRLSDRGRRAGQGAGHPAGVGGRLDLPLAERAPPGGRHR